MIIKCSFLGTKYEPKRKEERNEKAELVFDSDLQCQNLTFMGAFNHFLTILPFPIFAFYLAVLSPVDRSRFFYSFINFLTRGWSGWIWFGSVWLRAIGWTWLIWGLFWTPKIRAGKMLFLFLFFKQVLVVSLFLNVHEFHTYGRPNSIFYFTNKGNIIRLQYYWYYDFHW